MATLAEAINARSVEKWVDFLKTAEIPVLRQTADDIQALREREDDVSARDINHVVINDPMMVFKVLTYAQNHRSSYQTQDLVQVEQAVLMMGTNTFFHRIRTSPHVEDVLNHDFSALMDLLKLIIRAHRAGYFAGEFASYLKDLHGEEVRIAALLHDLAEMLMWCFNPTQMNLITQMQQADSTLRSKVAQQEVLGFKLVDLQYAVVKAFNLPPLLTNLMDEEHQRTSRVRNVAYAVNLARHSADGWDNAALPDDYKDIGGLLHVDVSRVRHIVGVPTTSPL